jgi:hypothetical protein
MPVLTVAALRREARTFAEQERQHDEPTLFRVTDGKAVGTYLEHKFRAWLLAKGYRFQAGNSASGVDFPDLGVDMKVTSVQQPQSSCPFKSASQKVYGLGYSLLVYVYNKSDDSVARTARLSITCAVFVDAGRTADFQLTRGLLSILANDGNVDDVFAYLQEKNLPLDEIGLTALAEQVLGQPPAQGYLTISNALQWRLQYRRVMQEAGSVEGLISVYREQSF